MLTHIYHACSASNAKATSALEPIYNKYATPLRPWEHVLVARPKRFGSLRECLGKNVAKQTKVERGGITKKQVHPSSLHLLSCSESADDLRFVLAVRVEVTGFQ